MPAPESATGKPLAVERGWSCALLTGVRVAPLLTVLPRNRTSFTADSRVYPNIHCHLQPGGATSPLNVSFRWHATVVVAVTSEFENVHGSQPE